MTPAGRRTETPAAIVLAGGASRRFGGDKLAAQLDGRSVLAHALDAAREIADLIVVVLDPDGPVPPAAAGCITARDAIAFGGPLAGLDTGLAALPPPVPEIAILVGGDMPSLVPAVLVLLVDALASDPALGVAILEADPPAMLPMAVRVAAVRPIAVDLLARDRRSLRGLVEAVPSAVVAAAEWRSLDPTGSTLRDVDLPTDLSER